MPGGKWTVTQGSDGPEYEWADFRIVWGHDDTGDEGWWAMHYGKNIRFCIDLEDAMDHCDEIANRLA